MTVPVAHILSEIYILAEQVRGAKSFFRPVELFSCPRSFHSSMQPSLLYSQEHAVGLCPEPDESGLYIHTLLSEVNVVIKLFSRLSRNISDRYLPSGFSYRNFVFIPTASQSLFIYTWFYSPDSILWSVRTTYTKRVYTSHCSVLFYSSFLSHTTGLYFAPKQMETVLTLTPVLLAVYLTGISLF